MRPLVFNGCIFVGWLLVLAGSVLINPGWGMANAGALLLALNVGLATLFAPRASDSSNQLNERNELHDPV